MKKIFNTILILIQLAAFVFAISLIVPAFQGQIIGAVLTLPITLACLAGGSVIAIGFIIYSVCKKKKALKIFESILLILFLVATAILFLKLYNII